VLSFDPQVAAALARLMASTNAVAPPPRGDWKTRRANGDAMYVAISRLQPKVNDVSAKDVTVTGYKGADLRARWFEKDGAPPGPAIIYIHGGGMMFGGIDTYDALLRPLVSTSAVSVLAVDYRLAPEHAHPTPVEDCYAALGWLVEHASRFGVDAGRIGVMGDSAGGGLAAATALLVRDRAAAPLAAQILIYPMLDDRNVEPDPELASFVAWSWDDNSTGWGALLGNSAGQREVSEYAAPTRAVDLSRLPPTYIEVGQLDIFCGESLSYERRLVSAHVTTEFHMRPGVPHGFDAFAPDAEVSMRAITDRVRALRRL
jgi:acetyl esterase/lipase